ncbi:uncharacterized protein LOC128227915 isoform X2 [Mya arenaria]|uniref:uncharacterized protein LOC128227915 isoform X2 n=1 Tax=Mya arenaria TaxID=6604 RepID=UPI0022E31DB1|nr:uncharacterized protein LOC128227915 isoform X2 [Mya arenaria]
MMDCPKKPDSWPNCLVLTNIPPETQDDLIKNYAEVICKRNVTSFNRQKICPSVAVVQFETAVTDQDISAWERRLEEKRLCRNRVTIQALGQPNGVVVKNVPHDVTDELLELYFENKRSGGLDGSVIDVDNKANGTYVVRINDLSAVKSILSKEGHTINGADVMVYPLFETLHRHLLKTKNADGPKLIPPVPTRPTGLRIGDTSQMPMEHKIDLFENAAPLIDHEPHPVERKRVFPSSSFQNMDVPVQVPPIILGSRVSGNVGIGRQFNRGQRERSNSGGERKDCRSEISLPHYKVILLIINGFGSKQLNSGTVSCNTDEKAGKVIICATTEEELKSVEINLYECLSEVKNKEKIIQAELAQFLNTAECKECLRTKLRNAKIQAAFEIQTDMHLNKIVMYAFIADELKRALEFIDDCLTVKELALTKGIDIKSLEMTVTGMTSANHTTKVYPSSSGIFICSFSKTIADDFENKLLKNIQSTRPKLAGHVELYRAKARCFKKCYLQNVESAMSQRKGSITWTETGHGAEYKLVVNVEGDEDDIKFIESRTNKIWSENFDFKEVCTDDADIWLLMTGFKPGLKHDFLTTCEERFNCWLDVSKEGEIIPPTKGRSRVSVDSEVVFSSDQSSSSESEGIGSHPENIQDMEQLLAVRAKPRSGRNNLTKFQPPDLSDEVALQAVLRESLRSSGEMSLTEGLYRSHDQEFRNRRQSSSPLSYSETISGVSIVIKKGELVKEHADVLVNILSPDMQLRESIVSKVFLESCGQRLQMEFDSAVRTPVITTTGCGLGCKDILHVGLKKGRNCECVSEVMKMILDSSENLQCQSLAMPPLGGGQLYQYPIQSVASLMFQVMTDHFQQGSSLQTITVMAYDKGTFDELKTALAQVRSSSPGSRHQGPQHAMTIASNLHGQIGLQRPQVRQFNAPPNNQFVRRQNDKPLQHRHSEPDIRSRQTSIKTYHETHAQSRVSERRGRQHSKRSQNKKRAPYYSKTDKITIKVFAKSKDECIKARSKISETMRDELLLEEKFDTVEHISKETKDSIVKIISKYNIRSIKGNKHYILKGKKENVSDAHKEILKLLIIDPEKSRERPRRKNVKRGTAEFAESMALKEANIPNYWELYKDNTTFSEMLRICKSALGKNYKKIAIDANCRTYTRIVKMVNGTFDSTKIGYGKDAKGLEKLMYSKLWITKIQRIENPQLFRQYVQKRQAIFLKLSNEKLGCWPTVGQLPNSSGEITTGNDQSYTMEKDLYSEINEVFLFHGTKPDTIQTICNNGLDHRLCSDKAMFGSGIYGAEKASKADQYTDDSSTRTGGTGKEKKMFLMRVTLGKCYLCTNPNPQKYRRPPCTKCKRDDCKTHDSIYDSVVGDNKKLFREFVVYDDLQCYPEYLITYERR